MYARLLYTGSESIDAEHRAAVSILICKLIKSSLNIEMLVIQNPSDKTSLAAELTSLLALSNQRADPQFP